MSYLRAQSLGSMDDDLVETFVRTGPEMLDFVEAHSELQFEIAEGFPDYKPELPGGRPAGGRSLNAKPFDLSRLGEWRDRITSFPADFSNVGIDAETRARIHASVDDESGDYCVAGTALIAGLLKGLLDLGVVPPHERPRGRADRRSRWGSPVSGSRTAARSSTFGPAAAWCWAPAGSNGTRSWSRPTCAARCAARSPRRTTPATACAWRWHTAPIWPTWARRGGCRSSRCPATPSTAIRAAAACDSNAPARRSIIVNRAGKRFLNEAGEYNSMAGPFHYLDPKLRLRQRSGVDRLRLAAPQAVRVPRRGARRTRRRTGSAPSADLAELGEKTGIDADGLAAHARRVERQRRPRAGSRLRPWRKRLRRLLGRRQGDHPGRQDARPHRHRAVLRRPGIDRRDGHQGRAAHRPRRPGAARQRRGRFPGCSPRATRWRARRARPTAARAEPSAPQWCSAIASAWRCRRGSRSASTVASARFRTPYRRVAHETAHLYASGSRQLETSASDG